MSIAVDRVWRDATRITPDRGAAGCVRDIETIAEELGEQARVLRLCATSAGTGELEQRLLELAGFDVGRTGKLGLLGNVGNAVVEDLLLRSSSLMGIIVSASRGQAVTQTLQPMQSSGLIANVYLRPASLASLPLASSSCMLAGAAATSGGVEREGPDGSVWADIGAVVALNANLRVPAWNRDGNATLFVGRNAQLELTIRMVYEG